MKLYERSFDSEDRAASPTPKTPPFSCEEMSGPWP